MNLVRKFVKGAAIGVGVAHSPEGLSAIQHRGCAATIWQRDPLPSFQSWIDAVQPEYLPSSRVVLRPGMVRGALSDIVEASELPSCEARAMLVDDISALADMFADVMRAPYLRLRLDVVTTNMCRKFHIDAVTARLICTYRGTGTQYGISTDGAEPRRIFTVPTGSPFLLRGTLWPENPKSGLLHRSPPIEGTGETRLVLVLDPIFDLDDEADEQFVH
ncbi:MAG: DUF1826 domain-containing protein [Rhodobacter sp.]|nr:DUF1826 domain-containing protein [Rhodobacter sp.]